MSVVCSFSSYYDHSADTPDYLPIAVLDTLLLLGFAGLAGIAVHAVLTRSRIRAGLAGAVVGAGATSAVVSGVEQGLGAPAALGALAAAAGVLVTSASGADHDPLGAARLAVTATGVGCALAGLRAGLEGGYFSTGSYGLGCVLWLACAAALLAARSALWGQRPGRLLVAGSAVADLLAVITANEGQASGCLLLGLHLAALTLLYAPGPARAAFGEDPLPGLVQARETIRRTLTAVRGNSGATRTGANGAAGRPDDSSGPTWSRLLASLPPWMYATVGLGAVLFVIGLVTLNSHSSAADACFVVGNRSLGLVRDTPDCDAAFDGEDTGKMVMGAGVLVALVPFRLVAWWEKQKSRSDIEGSPS